MLVWLPVLFAALAVSVARLAVDLPEHAIHAPLVGAMAAVWAILAVTVGWWPRAVALRIFAGAAIMGVTAACAVALWQRSDSWWWDTAVTAAGSMILALVVTRLLRKPSVPW